MSRKVVNITSVAATDGGAGQAGYSSGKAAVIGLTRTMAKEWGRYNVNVNAVGFGLIGTRLTQAWTADSKIEVKGREIKAGVRQEVLDQVIAASPLGRVGTVDEAARSSTLPLLAAQRLRDRRDINVHGRTAVLSRHSEPPTARWKLSYLILKSGGVPPR